MLVLAIVALEVPLIFSMRDRVDAEVRSQARSQAEFLAATVNLGRARRPPRHHARGGDRLRGRVIVVGRNGRLLADSAGTERVGVDYSSRPEIAAALKNTVAQERR